MRLPDVEAGAFALEKTTPARVEMRNGSDRTRAGVPGKRLVEGMLRHDWNIASNPDCHEELLDTSRQGSVLPQLETRFRARVSFGVISGALLRSALSRSR